MANDASRALETEFEEDWVFENSKQKANRQRFTAIFDGLTGHASAKLARRQLDLSTRFPVHYLVVSSRLAQKPPPVPHDPLPQRLRPIRDLQAEDGRWHPSPQLTAALGGAVPDPPDGVSKWRWLTAVCCVHLRRFPQFFDAVEPVLDAAGNWTGDPWLLESARKALPPLSTYVGALDPELVRQRRWKEAEQLLWETRGYEPFLMQTEEMRSKGGTGTLSPHKRPAKPKVEHGLRIDATKAAQDWAARDSVADGKGTGEEGAAGTAAASAQGGDHDRPSLSDGGLPSPTKGVHSGGPGAAGADGGPRRGGSIVSGASSVGGATASHRPTTPIMTDQDGKAFTSGHRVFDDGTEIGVSVDDAAKERRGSAASGTSGAGTHRSAKSAGGSTVDVEALLGIKDTSAEDRAARRRRRVRRQNAKHSHGLELEWATAGKREEKPFSSKEEVRVYWRRPSRWRSARATQEAHKAFVVRANPDGTVDVVFDDKWREREFHIARQYVSRRGEKGWEFDEDGKRLKAGYLKSRAELLRERWAEVPHIKKDIKFLDDLRETLTRPLQWDGRDTLLVPLATVNPDGTTTPPPKPNGLQSLRQQASVARAAAADAAASSRAASPIAVGEATMSAGRALGLRPLASPPSFYAAEATRAHESDPNGTMPPPTAEAAAKARKRQAVIARGGRRAASARALEVHETAMRTETRARAMLRHVDTDPLSIKYRDRPGSSRSVPSSASTPNGAAAEADGEAGGDNRPTPAQTAASGPTRRVPTAVSVSVSEVDRAAAAEFDGAASAWDASSTSGPGGGDDVGGGGSGGDGARRNGVPLLGEVRPDSAAASADPLNDMVVDAIVDHERLSAELLAATLRGAVQWRTAPTFQVQQQAFDGTTKGIRACRFAALRVVAAVEAWQKREVAEGRGMTGAAAQPREHHFFDKGPVWNGLGDMELPMPHWPPADEIKDVDLTDEQREGNADDKYSAHRFTVRMQGPHKLPVPDLATAAVLPLATTPTYAPVFVWHGRDILCRLARSLDFLGGVPELSEWYTDAYEFMRNPFGMVLPIDQRPPTPRPKGRMVKVDNEMMFQEMPRQMAEEEWDRRVIVEYHTRLKVGAPWWPTSDLTGKDLSTIRRAERAILLAEACEKDREYARRLKMSVRLRKRRPTNPGSAGPGAGPRSTPQRASRRAPK